VTADGADLPICVTCGVQYAAEGFDAEVCRICADERQYVGWGGQRWTTLAELRAGDRRSVVREETPGVWGIGAEPSIGIGQRALLVPGEGGNVLWDCVPYLDDSTLAEVRRLGGIAAIAVSHPHFYGSMIEWSEAFGGVPVYVHAADRQWVCRDGNVVFWEGDTLPILPGRTLVNCGVHFAGGTVLHWAGGADGRGALCSGDIFQVVMDRRWVSFMYSYPNLIPEHPETIRRAIDLVRPLPFEMIYGAWWGRVVATDAKGALTRSADRYDHHIGHTP
jgi:glyoxylase-like metal-dependent hydrolase (beta-lactamase superfamily II)